MIDKVALRRSEEGHGATVPGLPGCRSQGGTEAEALENIAESDGVRAAGLTIDEFRRLL